MLDLKEERQYKRLRDLGQKLHIPVPEAFWTLEVFDKDGNPVCPKCSFPAIKGTRACPNCGTEISHKQRSHSWTRNAYNSLFTHLTCKNATDGTFEAGKLSMKDVGAVIRNGAYMVTHRSDRSGDAADADFGILTPAANIAKGILVGSGTNAESFEDYVLQTPIAEGTGAGELNAVASELHSISYGALVLADEQVRYFNNNSGGNVSINEVCIADGVCVGSTATHHDCVTARDKLGATVTVPDTGQVKVTYTIQLTYPA